MILKFEKNIFCLWVSVNMVVPLDMSSGLNTAFKNATSSWGFWCTFNFGQPPFPDSLTYMSTILNSVVPIFHLKSIKWHGTWIDLMSIEFQRNDDERNWHLAISNRTRAWILKHLIIESDPFVGYPFFSADNRASTMFHNSHNLHNHILHEKRVPRAKQPIGRRQKNNTWRKLPTLQRWTRSDLTRITLFGC